MMNLDEAIIHAEEVAEINQSIADNTEHDNWMDIAQCEKCAEEHRQLAEWLKELKECKSKIPDEIYAMMKFYYFKHRDEHDNSWQGGFGDCMNLIINIYQKEKL